MQLVAPTPSMWPPQWRQGDTGGIGMLLGMLCGCLKQTFRILLDKDQKTSEPANPGANVKVQGKKRGVHHVEYCWAVGPLSWAFASFLLALSWFHITMLTHKYIRWNLKLNLWRRNRAVSKPW